MPTYEYACQSCGNHVEVYQRFNDEPLTACGVCGGPLRKVFHPAGILFKGSGFYKTDSRSGKSSGAASPAKKESAGAGSGGESGTGGSSSGSGKDASGASASPPRSKEKSA